MSKPSHVVVFDFDGTLIPSEYISLFFVIESVLNKNYQEEIQRVRNTYVPKILSLTVTPEENMLLITSPAEIYIKSGLTISQAKQALKIVNLRRGVLETMAFLHSQGIPIAIISYSFRQFIEIVLEENKAGNFISQIYGANLVVKNGLICGYRPETFVFSETKGVFSRRFARQHSVPAENILAVGDSAADFRLGYLKENRLGIAGSEQEKEEVKKFFGEVVITENFDPVLEWLKRRLNTQTA